jgi:O-methyltransferase
MDLVPLGDRSSNRSIIVRSLMDGCMLLNGCEAYQIIELVKATSKVPGALAEVGVSRGGSARLICEAKGSRDLHLFDTWEGLPDPNEADRGSGFRKGEFAASMEATSKYLSDFTGVHFYRGLFPETADPIRDQEFSFVHLDVDLHGATASALEFFYPRMSKSGVIMSHDYWSPGVRTAVDEFFRDKSEIVLQQPAGRHCVIVKL